MGNKWASWAERMHSLIEPRSRKHDGAHFRRLALAAQKKARARSLSHASMGSADAWSPLAAGQLDAALAIAIARSDASLAKKLMRAGATFAAGSIHLCRPHPRGSPPTLASAILAGSLEVAHEMALEACSPLADPSAWTEVIHVLFQTAARLRNPSPEPIHALYPPLPVEFLDDASNDCLAWAVSLAVSLIGRMPSEALSCPEAARSGASPSLLCWAPEPEIVQALLARGAELDAGACELLWARCNPLACAISTRRYSVIRELLLAGAKTEFPELGLSALALARRLEPRSQQFEPSLHPIHGSIPNFIQATIAEIERRQLAQALAPHSSISKQAPNMSDNRSRRL